MHKYVYTNADTVNIRSKYLIQQKAYHLHVVCPWGFNHRLYSFLHFLLHTKYTLPETNLAFEVVLPKRKVVFQSIFRGLLISGRVHSLFITYLIVGPIDLFDLYGGPFDSITSNVFCCNTNKKPAPEYYHPEKNNKNKTEQKTHTLANYDSSSTSLTRHVQRVLTCGHCKMEHIEQIGDSNKKDEDPGKPGKKTPKKYQRSFLVFVQKKCGDN